MKMLENDKSSSQSESESTDEDKQNNLKNENSLEDGNSGWADCILNVLNSDKPKTKNTLILSRAKKIHKIKEEKKPYDFEIEGEHKVKEQEKKPDKSEFQEKLLQIKKEKRLEKIKSFNLRTKPSIKDREREKALKKIAVKGVVQLFNAVRIQQKEINKELEKAGPLNHRKDAVLNNINKRKFLDVLMGGERSKSEFIDKPVKDEIKGESDDNDNDKSINNQNSEWSVLRDDFMTNKKLKHWDLESEDSENQEMESNSDTFSTDNNDSD